MTNQKKVLLKEQDMIPLLLLPLKQDKKQVGMLKGGVGLEAEKEETGKGQMKDLAKNLGTIHPRHLLLFLK